jgi:hypothetical protein
MKASIADNTTVKETARRPTGIEKVFINGEVETFDQLVSDPA